MSPQVSHRSHLHLPLPLGPHIPWRPGRSDYAPDQFVALPDGRLPDGDKDAKHIRDIFYRCACVNVK